MVSYCAGCNEKITDPYLMKVLDKTWHGDCLICCECSATLAEKCFAKDGKFYCKTDFFKKHGIQCRGCKEQITYTDLIRRTGTSGDVYHVHCFTCRVCSRQLDTGEEFYTLPPANNTFICKNDFTSYPPPAPSAPARTSPDNEVHSTTGGDTPANDSGRSLASQLSAWNKGGHRPLSPHQLSPASHLSPPVVSTTVHESPNSDSNTKQDSSEDHSTDIFKKEMTSDNDEAQTNSPETSSSQVSTTTGKRRGPRTTIKSKQLEILKDAFNKTPKPTRHIREQLATKTGLNMRVIQVWFQNRRSKERRMKQMNLASRGRYGTPLSRDHHDDYGYVQDHFYRGGGGECYYGDVHHPHSVEQGFMQCLQVPGMDPGSRSGTTGSLEHWTRGHYDTAAMPQHGPHSSDMLNLPGYSAPLAASWTGMTPDSTNQIAFQT